jgi:outer membrane lipoprotein-sorting protein
MRCTEGHAPVNFDLQSDPIMQMVAEQLWLWLEGDYARLQKDYIVAQTGESTLKITPLAEHTSTIIESVTLIFDETSRQPGSVTIAEPSGDVTVIEFTDHSLDPTLPEELFTQCYGQK